MKTILFHTSAGKRSISFAHQFCALCFVRCKLKQIIFTSHIGELFPSAGRCSAMQHLKKQSHNKNKPVVSLCITTLRIKTWAVRARMVYCKCYERRMFQSNHIFSDVFFLFCELCYLNFKFLYMCSYSDRSAFHLGINVFLNICDCT